MRSSDFGYVVKIAARYQKMIYPTDAPIVAWQQKDNSMPDQPPTYTPAPIDTAHVALSADVMELTEKLAEHNHDIWAKQRLKDGWTWGEKRDDENKHHPCLIPYADLPKSEKEYDRNAAIDTLKAIVALGYEIRKPSA